MAFDDKGQWGIVIPKTKKEKKREEDACKLFPSHPALEGLIYVTIPRVPAIYHTPSREKRGWTETN